MNKVILLQEAGFLWDLYFIFYLRFNDQAFPEGIYRDTSINAEFYKEIYFRFGDIPEDLYVFFHAIGASKRTFFQDHCLKTFAKNFINEYNVEYLQQELADYDRVIQKMIAFYLKGIKQQELKECLHSKDVLFDHIKTSGYSMEEKIKLYEFFMDPASYITLFRRTLTAKQSLLSDYYKEHYKDIIHAHDPMALDVLNEKMNHNAPQDIQQKMVGYVSYCLLDRFHLDLISTDHAYLYVLGDQYQYTLTNPSPKPQSLSLEKVCHALCEKNRVDILDLLYEQGEVTCKDLERVFDFSGSTAYHHISIMARAGVVKTRNEGKTIFYSIDKLFMDDVADLLRKYGRS